MAHSPAPHDPSLRSAGLGLLEVVARRSLIWRLCLAELRRDGAGMVLGQAWWIADPLLQMAIYSLLVNVIFQRSIADYPLFVLPALLAWKWLSGSISGGTSSITGNERVIRQVAFPRLVLPLARLLAEVWRYLAGLAVLFFLMSLFWSDHLSWALVWLPILIAVQFVFMLPFAIAGAAANVSLRDLSNILRHALRLALYLSPVLYGLEQLTVRLPAQLAVAYELNPLALMIQNYRDVVYFGAAPTMSGVLLPLGVGLVLLGPALAWFRRREPRFAKIL
jgi:lipopolysaccharide transport system permease protein